MRHARPFFYPGHIQEFTEPRTVVSGMWHQCPALVTQPQIALGDCILLIPLATARGSVTISPPKLTLLESLFRRRC